MREIFRLSCFGVVAASVPIAALAQDIEVAGIVRSADGSPIIAARVRVPPGGGTVTTDSTGRFRLVVAGRPAPDRTLRLIVERIGFVPRDTVVMLQSLALQVDVVMRALAQPLDETIVTGTAGSRSRRTQPGVVATISVAELSRTTPLSTIPEALQGRVTSVDLTPSDGSVGGSQRLWIRGGASVAISNEPLVYVDGVRIDVRSQRATTNTGGQASSRLFDIDPADIERIEIAKGPAAATLYGTDAAGGVIQIFTRRSGPAGGQQSFELQAGLLDPNWTPPTNYATCGVSDVLPSSTSSLCHGRQPGDIIADNPLRRSGVPSTGETWSARWAASGGTGALRSNASINVERQTGSLPQNRFERNAFRLGTTWEGSRSLRVDAGIALMATNTDLPQNADNPEGILVNGLLGSPLTVGGRLGGWAMTPVDALATVEQRNAVLRATPTVQVTHSAGLLSQRLIAGIDATSSNGVFFVPLRFDDVFQANWRQGVTGEDYARYAVRTFDYLATADVLDPSRSAAGLRLSAGAQFVQTDEDRFQVTGFGLVSNDARRVSDAADRRGNQTFLLQTRSLGYFGQIETSVHDRLFLQLGARSDYQSAFGSDAGAPWFPKAGLSYFMIQRPPEAGAQVIERLRLRAAYGTSGRAPPQGEAGATFSAAPFILEPGRIAQGVVPASPGNDRLKPERSRELELGFDAELLGDRLGLEVTWFDKQSSDLLFRLPVPPSYGFRLNPMTNVGSVENTGWEVTGRWLVPLGTAKLSGQAGVSTLANRVVDLGEAAAAAATNGIRRDFPLGALLDRPLLRIDTIAGQAIVGDSAEFVAAAMPTRTGFASAILTLGSRWHFAVTFDGKRGNAMINSTHSFRDRQTRNGYRSTHMHELSAEERLTRFGPFVTEGGTAVSANNVLGPYLQDASFVRWREASITVDLPPGMSGRLGGRSASLTAAGRNLLLWTRYDGDPETVTYVSELSRGGVFQYNQFNFMSMPQARRWVLRVAVRF